MNIRIGLLIAVLVGVVFLGTGPGVGATPPASQCAPPANYPAATTPVAFWSTEARCAIVPAGPGGVFGPENFGNKFPGEAAVYMGIVHASIYDAAVAIEGGYTPYTTTSTAPVDTSPGRRCCDRSVRHARRPPATTREPTRPSSTTTTPPTWLRSRTGGEVRRCRRRAAGCRSGACAAPERRPRV